jgi:alpha-tubulin suppressor-like RCC1 family protein
MGVVWKARDEETGQTVALKLLREAYADDPDYLGRFERELELARRIDSPNVVKVLGYGVRQGVPYLALEYVEGQSLRDLIASHGPYNWDETRALLIQIATGLADAHAAGVIHRDVKPSNVLLASDGTAKLTDFGIARGLDLTRVTATSTLLGTPAYLPPEGPEDERSDLYSLGVIGYELLVGTPPFEGKTYQAVMLAHLRTPPDLTRLPAEAQSILSWLLAKDPVERPQSAGELLAVLRGGATVPAQAVAEPVPTPLGPPTAKAQPVPVSRLAGRRAARRASAPTAAVYDPSAKSQAPHIPVPAGAGVLLDSAQAGRSAHSVRATLVALGLILVVGVAGLTAWGLMRSGPSGHSRSNATAIAAGQRHTCALLVGGTVACWGDNVDGELGDGTSRESHVAVSVSGLRSATAVTTGDFHTCALLTGDTIECWGNNGDGELGDGTTKESHVPVSVLGITSATAIAAGAAHTCALLSGGTIECWGANGSGQLGHGATNDSSIAPSVVASSMDTNPAAVSGVSDATAIAAGFFHTCALLSGGTIQCWGDNTDGQLGDGTTNDSSTPVAVSGISGATAIAAGFYFTCALLTGGKVECWGDNTGSQLGDGTINDSSTPVSVLGVSGATAIAAGEGHTCALVTGGTVECWGTNGNGQLGDGVTNDSPTPVSVSGVSGATAIAAGQRHTCAILADGAIECWGFNVQGQLGNGTTTDSPTPVQVVAVER